MNLRMCAAVLAVLVTVSGATTTTAATPAPQVDLIGPIPTTATSHPFNVSTVDLASHGYVEEEFFLTVVVELMNMTNRWDLDRMWLTSHDQYLRDGTRHVTPLCPGPTRPRSAPAPA